MSSTSHINVRHRLTQIIVLVVVILATMLFSQVAKAQGSMRYDKAKYRIQVHKDSNKTCSILKKKRNSQAKHPMMASARRSSKSRAVLAETENPGVASSN
ncbi:MAG: hypothetical protein HOP08_17440 [Cyclobacteriaceae bacterium]|nr:hypothetical protein [Cyclobacteriaceae bacterium]